MPKAPTTTQSKRYKQRELDGILHIRAPQVMLDELKDAATEENADVAWLVRRWLREKLDARAKRRAKR